MAEYFACDGTCGICGAHHGETDKWTKGKKRGRAIDKGAWDKPLAK